MKIKRCRCKQCRYKLHSRYGGIEARALVRSARHHVKQMLHRAGEDADEKLPTAVSLPYQS